MNGKSNYLHIPITIPTNIATAIEEAILKSMMVTAQNLVKTEQGRALFRNLIKMELKVRGMLMIRGGLDWGLFALRLYCYYLYSYLGTAFLVRKII